jgi:hypothetical protein
MNLIPHGDAYDKVPSGGINNTSEENGVSKDNTLEQDLLEEIKKFSSKNQFNRAIPPNLTSVVLEVFNVNSLKDLAEQLKVKKQSFEAAFAAMIEERPWILEPDELTIYGIKLDRKSDGEIWENIIKECLLKVGYNVNAQIANHQEFYTETAKELAKLSPATLAAALKKIYDLSPNTRGDLVQSKMIRRIIRGFSKLPENTSDKLLAAISIMEKNEPGSFEKMYIGVDYAEDNALKQRLMKKLQVLDTGRLYLADNLNNINADQIKDLSKEEILAIKKGYFEAIEMLRKKAGKVIDSFPSASVADQVKLEKEYGQFLTELDRMKREVERTFGPMLDGEHALRTKEEALKAKKEVHNAINSEIVDRAIAVREMNARIREDIEQKIAKGEKPRNIGLRLTAMTIACAQKAAQELEKSEDAQLAQKGREGQMAMTMYIADLKAFDRLAVTAAWTLKDVELIGTVAGIWQRNIAEQYNDMKGTFTGLWNGIKEKAQGAVEKVLADNRKYFAWLDKIVAGKKEEQKAEEKKQIVKKKYDIQEILARAEEQNNHVQKDQRERAKRELANRIITADNKSLT